jgi:cystathionine beta-synthase
VGEVISELIKMSLIHNNILETIGGTPIIKLNSVSAGIKARILAKLEFFNPGGSVKDRIGNFMIEDAEKRGLLTPGGIIVEPTSGNTGVGLAIAAAIKGYKIVFTIPDKMSQEKINLLKAYGAKVIVTPTAVSPDSPESYYSVAERIVEENPNAFMPGQYTNQKNPEPHYLTTGPEIWQQTEGKIDYFVAGMGTGGTISGVGKYLKEKNPDIKIIGADPVGSILKDYFYTKEMVEAHTYKVEGIGEDIIPETTHFEYIDEIYKVTDMESLLMTRRLAREEGILAGSSSGSAVVVALRVAKELEEDKTVVVLIPDTGERYLSKVHSDEWMRENGYLREDLTPLKKILEEKRARIPNVVSVNPDMSVSSAIDLMKQYNISQLPVMESDKSVGSIREETIIRMIMEDKEIKNAKIKEVMEESFPTVNIATDLTRVCQMLERGSSTLLIENEGRIEGIISRIDIIEYLSKEGE